MKAFFTLTTLLLPLFLVAETSNFNQVEGIWVSSFADYRIEVRALRGGIEVKGLRDFNRWTLFDREGRSDRYRDTRGNLIILRRDRLEYQPRRNRGIEVFLRPRPQVRPRDNSRANDCWDGRRGAFTTLSGLWFSRGGDRLRINQRNANRIMVTIGRRSKSIALQAQRNQTYISRCGRFRVVARGDRLSFTTPRGTSRYKR